MKPDSGSSTFLAITRSKGKMYEYGVPEADQIAVKIDPARLFIISIGILGDLAAIYNRSGEISTTLRESLLFSAHYFDAYLQSRLDRDIDPYLLLLGSTSYYLCNLQGSSNVLANTIDNDHLDLKCGGIENLLVWLLQNDLRRRLKVRGPFIKYIQAISDAMVEYTNNGTAEERLFTSCANLQKIIYTDGTPRQLLLADAVYSIVKKRYENSTWFSLPKYSNLSKDKWAHTLKKQSFIKELWPAQHLLGHNGILLGKSAVIQMPTSAGKTKSIELIIRSSFLSEKTSLAVIVAPFRALCHEIKNSLLFAFEGESVIIDELSDVLQSDFNFEDLFNSKKILIVTPEKLLYVLRHNPEIATSTGLLILDEGHQFDNGTRGTTYELLLTSLRLLLPETTQRIILSAVISNADIINKWFNGDESVVISGTDLIPTFRSIAFTSWLSALGQIQYVSNSDIEVEEFYVPKVIESFPLEKKSKERKIQMFPDKFDSKTISLYLGLKLAPNGGIAIFCGTKQSAINICNEAVDVFERKLSLSKPIIYSNKNEVLKLSNLYRHNLGSNSIITKSAELGIFSHHGNIPHGIRIAVESSMRDGLIHFVICTSTLSQGVNLPIKYLIVNSLYQGVERIKIRDFHNLIGRAGRSGMHTEGSIIFADPLIYDRKRVRADRWKWRQVKQLLELTNSEPCISNLLSLFDPIKSSDGKYFIQMNTITFLDIYINGPDEVVKFFKEIVDKYGKDGFPKEYVESQIVWKMGIISSIESFLMSHWSTDETEIFEKTAISLAEGTLAYYLSDEKNKKQICTLFSLISKNIIETIKDVNLRKIYGRTLYGMWDAKEIAEWVEINISNLLVADESEILNNMWSLLTKYIHSNLFSKCDKPPVMQELFREWIKGTSFGDLYDILKKRGAQRIWGSKFHQYQVEDVVEICENGFSYNGTLLIGAIIEFVSIRDIEEKDVLIHKLQLFQKKIKYGLPLSESIILYEMGFSDRTISQQLTNILGKFENRYEVKSMILKESKKLKKLIDVYPAYYQSIYSQLFI